MLLGDPSFLSGEAIGWLMAASSVVTVVSALLVFRTRSILNRIQRLLSRAGRTLVSGAGSGTGNEAPDLDRWQWRLIHAPGNFWALRWTVRLSSAYIMYVAAIITLMLTWIHLDFTHFRAERQEVVLVNETDDIIHYRYARHLCVDGPNEYFDDSISLGDPRLKPLPPARSVSLLSGLMDYQLDDDSRCFRFGVVDDAGNVMLLHSFTTADMNRQKWKVSP